MAIQKLKNSSTSKASKKKKPRTPEQALKRVETKRSDLERELKGLEIPSPRTPNEARYIEEYVHMLDSNAKIIRRLERQIKHSTYLRPRDLYALSTMMSQQREVIADIRSISDLSEQTELLLTKVLQPMISSLGQNLLDSYYQKRRLLIETCKEKETKFAISKLDEVTREQGKFIQQLYTEAAEKIQKMLLGG